MMGFGFGEKVIGGDRGIVCACADRLEQMRCGEGVDLPRIGRDWFAKEWWAWC